MVEVELDYANGKMEGAARFQVFNRETGERLFNIVEANATEGWYKQIVTVFGVRQSEPVKPGDKVRHWKTEQIACPVRIVRLEQSQAEVTGIQARRDAKRARQAASQAKGMARA